MFIRSAIVSFAIAVVIGSAAHAATPADVATVAKMVTEKSVPVLLRRQEFVDGRYMGDTVVFVQDGLRYTIFNAESIPNSPGSLSFWVRKNGTTAQRSGESFTDHGFDGTVDFGIDGPQKRIFHSGADGDKPEGLQFKSFWQKKYDAAIAAALEYKRQRDR